MENNSVHLISTLANKSVCGFSCVEDAVRFAGQKGLERGFRIEDEREEYDPERIADTPLRAAFAIRETLLSHWISMQFDRLLRGEISHLPKDPAMGLAVPSVIYADLALKEAGATGWSAVVGSYSDPSPYPEALRHHTQEPVTHAWLEHEDGTILDLSRRIFHRNPVTVLHPQGDGIERLIAQRQIASRKSEIVAGEWFDLSGPQILAELRNMRVDLVLLTRPQASSEMAL